jgi:lysine-specific permease
MIAYQPLTGSPDSPLPQPVPDAAPNFPAKRTEVKRSLKTRHLTMIALGGSIGTGLFLASGQAISSGGPGGAALSFILVGAMVAFLMAGLGELATFLPVSGSFSAFSERYVDASLGFASGWNEFVGRSITFAVEILTCGLLVRLWLPALPSWYCELPIFVVIFLVNAFTVRSFGEIEFWMSMVKVVAILFSSWSGF